MPAKNFQMMLLKEIPGDILNVCLCVKRSVCVYVMYVYQSLEIPQRLQEYLNMI